MIASLASLAASVLFVVGLRRLRAVPTARSGNAVSLVGMGVAVAATLAASPPRAWGPAAAGLGVGAAAGLLAGGRVRMTAMPQMVALLNGLGGLASALVAMAEVWRGGAGLGPVALGAAQLTAVVGGVTFAGSLVAFGKLQELIPGRPLALPGLRTLHGGLAAAALALAVRGLAVPGDPAAFLGLNVLALGLGVLLAVPVGGADMPVLVAFLNAGSGVAAATTGFVLGQDVLVVTGALVGASGLILTRIMCQGMGRSLADVLRPGPARGPAAGPGPGAVTEGRVEDAVTVLAHARSVIVVPGYGMAAAQAQRAVRALGDLLAARGTRVRYAIHPVAGRMPGHMNVLLAEAEVPYDQLFDLEAINEDFATTDAVLVVGANDVVNPAARTDPASPIYGMPILDADRARTVIVLKRSLRPGFAGIDNPLFLRPGTMMVFGDARTTLEALAAALRA